MLIIFVATSLKRMKEYKLSEVFSQFKKINYYLNFICPIRIDRKQVVISAIYEFVLIFLFIILFKSFIFNELSIYSLLEISFTVAFFCALSGGLYFYNYAKKIDPNTWTYKKDILNYLKFVFIIIFLLIVYFFYGLKYFYRNELSIVFSYLTLTRIIIYSLFIGILAYVFLRFINHLKLFFKDSINHSLDFEINKDIDVVISDVSEYVEKLSSLEIAYTKREK